MAQEYVNPVFSGDDTIDLVKNLIRYDIPFLLLGKSSIGKSYSITELAQEFRMPHSFLFIGSEKPSNIEGLPRLVGQKAESGDILEFFKPNWFPNASLIQKYITNGKKVFENYVKVYEGDKVRVNSGKDFKALNTILEALAKVKWDTPVTLKQSVTLIDTSTSTSKSLGTTLNKPFTFTREIETETQVIDPNKFVKDEMRDMCLYLTTILGYGNYWLILDELDKVDEREKDKYAPLLHITRERHIKDYSFRTLNNGNGAGVPEKVISGSKYTVVKGLIDEAIKEDLPLLDGRVIGIANATAEIEDALFRRFCHIVVEEVMMVNKPDQNLAKWRMCFQDLNQKFGGSELGLNLEMKFIPEINLQWQFGFFPKMLNTEDSLGNYFRLNLNEQFRNLGAKAEANKERYISQIMRESYKSAISKIIRNNFAVVGDSGQIASEKETEELRKSILECIIRQMGVSTDTDIAPEEATAGVIEESEGDILREEILGRLKVLLEENEPSEVAKLYATELEGEFPSQALPPPVLVDGWVSNLLTAIQVTLIDEDGNVNQMTINKYLTPVLLKTLYKKVLSASMDENAKKMQIHKANLKFEKMFMEHDISPEAVSFDGDITSEMAKAINDEVLPQLELSYMGTDVWFLIDNLMRGKQGELLLEKEHPNLLHHLRTDWGEQFLTIVNNNIQALDKKLRISPKSKAVKQKLERAVRIRRLFQE